MNHLYTFLFVLYAIFCTTICAHAKENDPDTVFMSLDEVWTQAFENSKVLKQQQLQNQIKEEDVLTAKRSILPEVGLDADYGHLSDIPVFVNGITKSPDYIPLTVHHLYNVNLEAYLNLYNGGATKTAIASAEAKLQMQHHIQEETTDQLHLEVIQYYLDLQRNFQFQELIQHNIHQSEERLRLIRQLNKNGVVLKSDLLRSELQISQQETQLTTIRNNIALISQSLNILMGKEDEIPLFPMDSVSLDETELSKDYYSFVEESLEKSPLEKMAENQIKISELQVNALKADKRPHLGLFGSYSYSFPQIMLYPYETASYFLGVTGIKLSYNVSALYHDKHKERAAEIMVDHQKVAKSKVDDALREKLKTAYERFQEDLKKVEVAKSDIAQAQENYRIVNQTYFNQLSLLTDLLDADNQLLQARFELVDNLIAAKSHYYQLLKISGEL